MGLANTNAGGKEKLKRERHKDTMPPTGTKVNTILQTFYQSVLSLEEWIRDTDTEGLLESSLVTEADPKGYKHLLETTLVAVKGDGKQLTAPISLSQDSHQHELVTRCVQRVLHRDGVGNNVLSFGFGPVTDNPKASVSSVLDIEYRYPNTSVSRLQYKVWKTLLSRIGDTFMCHLLENTSVFILLAKPAVYLQITGEPVYQLWPYSAGSHWVSKGHDHQSSKTANSVKTKGKQNKAAHLPKHGAQEREGASENSGPARRTSSSVSLYPPLKRKRCDTDSLHPPLKRKRCDTDSLYPPLKRKRCDTDSEKCCKKQKLAERDGTSAKGPAPLSASPEDVTLRSASDVSLTMVPETSGGSVENLPADGVNSTEMKCDAEIARPPEVASKTKRQKKRMKQKKKKKEKQKPCTPGTKGYRYHLYVPRLSLLYGKYLKEKFPVNFSPARLSPSEEGARLLLTNIFVRSNVGQVRSSTDQPCQCQDTAEGQCDSDSVSQKQRDSDSVSQKPCDSDSVSQKPCDSDSVSQKQCDSDSVSQKPCDSDSVSQKQCDSDSVSHPDSVSQKQRDSDSVSQKQCDSDSVSQKQCDSDSVSQKQCDSDSVSQKQCDSDSVSQKQCDSDSVSHPDSVSQKQRDSDSVSQKQRDSDSVSQKQCDSDSVSQKHCDSDSVSHPDSVSQKQRDSDSVSQKQCDSDSVSQKQCDSDSVSHPDSVSQKQRDSDSVSQKQCDSDSVSQKQLFHSHRMKCKWTARQERK
ncbi:uncharacterized protein LOC143295973 [Babylonia areolata]|uniref:uncharacterized protein LOC143295973 n=1 Tax=Babylonia areolata TaxID=304850 RepID=UPI003FCF5D3A